MLSTYHKTIDQHRLEISREVRKMRVANIRTELQQTFGVHEDSSVLKQTKPGLIKLLISKKLHQVRKDAENTITQSMQLGGRRELAKVAMYMQEQEFCKKWKVTANDTAASKPSSSSGSSRKRKRKEETAQNQSTDT